MLGVAEEAGAGLGRRRMRRAERLPEQLGALVLLAQPCEIAAAIGVAFNHADQAGIRPWAVGWCCYQQAKQTDAY